jgi:hypothetical protein
LTLNKTKRILNLRIYHGLKMNIFEGGRRIAKLTAALIVVAFVVNFFEEYYPPVSVSYLIAGATKPPVRVEQCEVSDISQTHEINSKSGTTVNVTLCFKSSSKLHSKAKKTYDVTVTFSDGTTHTYTGAADDITPDIVQARAEKEFKKKVVHLDGGRNPWDTNAAGSFDLATAIPVEALDAFQIPKADEGYITRLIWLQKAQSAGIGLLKMLASLVGFWLFVWTVGWIVRGFRGIPQGKDRIE